MPGKIRQDDVEAVRERTDIVQVISGYLQLKKAGRDSLVGLCPFHPEKTPSLSVSPSKQVYYCFGCHEGGNVFRFLEKVENLSFVEAVERLATAVNVTLRYEGDTASGRRAADRRTAIHRAIEDAAALYRRMLADGREAEDARAYVAQRGITPESVERFGIGYTPGYSDFLLRRLGARVSPELLVEAGLLAKDGSGAHRDRFRGRLMFPIHDLAGHAVGFGGRLIAGPATKAGANADAASNAPKYLNSPETSVYRKGSLLYNLNRAKTEISRAGRAFLVEGYTDVIALDQAGIRNAVATCGTALGEEHVRLLSRFTERLVLAFDSDEAGARAAERAFSFHEAYPVDVSVLVLPRGQDPADFVLEHGGGPDAGAAFEELLAGAVPLVEYMLERLLLGRDLSTVEERARAARAGLEIVAPLEDPVRRHEYARILAGKVGEPEMAVMLQLERMAGGAPGGRDGAGRVSDGSGNGTGGPRRSSPEDAVEREALKLLVQAPELGAELLSAADAAERFAKPTHRRVFEVLADAHRSGAGRAAAPDLVAAAQERGEQLGRLMAALAVEPVTSEGAPTPEYAARLFLRLEEFSLKRRADALRKQIERLNPLKSPVEHESMFEELIALEGARRRVRVQAESVGTGV